MRMNPTIAVHESLPSVGLHGLALAGYPPRPLGGPIGVERNFKIKV